MRYFGIRHSMFGVRCSIGTESECHFANADGSGKKALFINPAIEPLAKQTFNSFE
jgi:hypothetical protein